MGHPCSSPVGTAPAYFNQWMGIQVGNLHSIALDPPLEPPGFNSYGRGWVGCIMYPGPPLFTKQMDILPQDLVKFQSHEIWV